jgi:hypothetical protein
MFKRLSYASLLLGVASGCAAWGQPAIPPRVGTLSHIAAGGAWDTTIWLVNTSSAPVTAELVFHADDGSSLSLPLSVTLEGATQSTTAATLQEVINPNTVLIVDAGLPAEATVVGWADVLATGPLSGFAIFRWTPPNSPVSEGTVPLQTQFQSTLVLPYDNTADFLMGVALANLSATQAVITATIWDENGNQLGAPTITVAGSGHTSFVMPTELPLSTAHRGIVQFQNPSGGALDGIGLRFSPGGTTFTSVPTTPQAPLPVPQITSMNPENGQVGTTVNLVISGTNLSGVTAVQFSPSAGITVSNVNATATQVTATVVIAASATAGQATVTVSSAAGTSNALDFSVQSSPAPQITSLSPTSGQAGTSPYLFISGANLLGVTSVQFSPSEGISGTPQQSTIFGNSTATNLITTLVIAANATPGPRNVSVTSPSGTSNTAVYTILAPASPPQITSLSPASGQAGSAVGLVINGTNLTGVTVVQFSPSQGITVSNVSATATQVTATVTIPASAAAGQVNVSVSSPAGTSNTLPFTIQSPSPYAGQWNGSTNQGLAMSFTVTGNNVTAYSYNVNFPNLGASCPVSENVTSGPATSIPITGNSFTNGTLSGTFQSAMQASGAVNWTLSLPGCNASGTVTWNATN